MKKMIEVALPLLAINEACADDKGRKTGHIRNLHKWFAPMPLPALRVAILASIIDDPGDGLPPEEAAARRKPLLALIERVAPLDAHLDRALMENVRGVIRAQGPLPVVVDPFCGGASTVVEAQRLGLPTQASDLNPVAVLITTALCLIPPLVRGRGSVMGAQSMLEDAAAAGLEGFLTDVRAVAALLKERAWAKLGDHYPPTTSGGHVIAWRWARTVVSPDPAVGGRHTPLVSTWLMSKGRAGRTWLSPISDSTGDLCFELRSAGTEEEPTIGKGGARCIYGGGPIPLSYIRREGKSGRLGAVMFGMVEEFDGRRSLSAPTATQIRAAAQVPYVEELLEMPRKALGFRVQEYGITDWGQLFTPRQQLALTTFAELLAKMHPELVDRAAAAGWDGNDMRALEDGGVGARAYADAVSAVLALAIGKMAQSNCMLVRWFIDPRSGAGKATPAFGRHVVQMMWDFVETNPFGGSVGDFTGPVLETALRAFALVEPDAPPSRVEVADAREVAGRVGPGALVVTDPPYYANVGYGALSDFFYPWIRRAARPSFPRLTQTISTPKAGELIADPARHKGGRSEAEKYFRDGFAEVFGALTEHATSEFPMTIVYALKQQESTSDGVSSTGWEAFLDGLLTAGIQIVATWPIRTSSNTRMRAIGSNALASAILVVCRRRPDDAEITTRREFLAELRESMPRSIAALEQASIAPVDLAQSAIGPGMAVFSARRAVIDADGSFMSTKAALQAINQTVDECLGQQDDVMDADTRFALTWFETHGFNAGPFGEAETLAKARNVSVAGVQDAGVLHTSAGKARLLARNELPSDWDPRHDERLTVWEGVQHLIRVLEADGETAAASLLAALGPLAGSIRSLAYRLYSVCDRRGWADEARAYNGLVVAWPELERLAGLNIAVALGQQSMFE